MTYQKPLNERELIEQEYEAQVKKMNDYFRKAKHIKKDVLPKLREKLKK
jgi:hypothetical protein